MPTFTVLCRIDAYADYIAEVEADDAEEAAELARYNHDDYKWEHDQTAEFDDRSTSRSTRTAARSSRPASVTSSSSVAVLGG